MKLTHTDTYELLDATDNNLSHASDERSPRPSGYHLPPRPLHRYRRRTWRNGITIFFAFCFAGACLAGIVLGAMISAYSNWGSLRDGVHLDVCTSYKDAWGLNMLTETTMSFKAVKILDAGINLVFGRGFQIFCGWLSYQVFGMATLRIIQDNKVPIPFLCAMSFDPVSLRAFYYQLRTVLLLKTARAKAIVIWLAVSMVYLVFMPLLLDLMTGYIAVYDTYISVPGNDLSTSLRSFDNSTIQTQFAAMWLNQYMPGSDADYYCHNYFGVNQSCPSSLYYYGYNFTANDLIDTTGQWRVNDTDRSNSSYFLKCSPSAQYSWGVSSGWCLVLSIVTLLWVIGMCSIWFDTMRFGHIWHSGRGFGEYRNLLDIAQHLDRSLGPDTCAYAHHELKRAVKKLPPVGLEVVSNGTNGTIRLSETPGGHEHLRRTGTNFGGTSRLRKGGSDNWSSDTHGINFDTQYKSGVGVKF